ncbi:DUF488 domain-containing protein [Brachybacterium hainanense]|uniref:DUF488 domain-containing protein n=1 Tax=Brachybacterium hainanense TaxID=1541174 RepID=A0ABV6R980_9MICO
MSGEATSLPDGPQLRIVRVHEVLDTPAEDGELRVLVDRLWPRGVRKERLQDTWWDKDACPSAELRREYHSGALERPAFAARYRAELDRSGAAEELLGRARGEHARVLSLLVAERDLASSHVHVLVDALVDAASPPHGDPPA